PWRAIFSWRVGASSSFLRHCDEAPTLLNSQPQICAIGADGGQALQAPSPEQRRNRLLTVRRFAIALHAEDPRHEVPSADLFGRASHRRRAPYIYDPGDIRRLIDAAHRLGPDGSIRPLTYATMFGLIATTGMRVSEALAIRLPDVTDDGLIIAQTKFKKSRLLPLHPTTRHALDGYLATRLKEASLSDALFISHQGTPLA
ncbi:tyrosine-type recombinase/integrase, partial [Novosphingobium flavum]|uniref:tyrosine-type recombinase/integrase n=1 Tax=Novosphingobium aerophilum TaxID=2839843 RepID=UPI00163AF5A6